MSHRLRETSWQYTFRKPSCTHHNHHHNYSHLWFRTLRLPRKGLRCSYLNHSYQCPHSMDILSLGEASGKSRKTSPHRSWRLLTSSLPAQANTVGCWSGASYLLDYGVRAEYSTKFSANELTYGDIPQSQGERCARGRGKEYQNIG